MQILSARQSYYDKAGVQILIMSDIFQIYTSNNAYNGPQLEIILMSTLFYLNVTVILAKK